MSDNLLNKLTQLKLPAMAGSLIRQREPLQIYDELSFEERLRAEQMRELLNSHYIIHNKNLLITRPTGCGKSWISNALGEQACWQKHSVQYWRVGRLLEMLAQGHVDGSWLKQLQETQVLILDDLDLEPLTNAQCNDLLVIIEDSYGQSSTIVVSQFLVDKWHGLMENPTAADASKTG